MLRTFGIRISAAIISLLIVVVAGQMLGAQILGQISLMIVSITIINLVGGFAGGSALVYLIPRNKDKALLPVSQLWAIVSGFATATILYLIDAFPAELVLHVFVLGIIGSLIQNYMSVLLANQRIKEHNLLTLLQSVLMVAVLLLLTFGLKIDNILAYVFALYAAYIPVLVASALMVLRSNKAGQGSASTSLKILFSYGSLVQLSSIFALLSYRLTYYYTEAWLGLAALGVLAVAAQISEAVWILPKSIALVQFSKIANLKRDSDSAQLTFFLGVVTTIFTLVALSVLVLIPDTIYTWIFGSDFVNINPVVQLFAPGIFAIALNIILSHYFSGSGRIAYNLIGSAIGLVTVAVVGWLLIQGGDISSAAMVSTVGYTANFLYAWFCFLWVTRGYKLSFKRGMQVFKTAQNEQVK